ncbi:MAG: hypothetical protein KME25_21265 [Symplocastrum torsivum CPER-KK1]|uniref:Uncharacterized protein n=1 Tax=Symplocastrum torsivum CPER-KK1 TaxID=450513 RepID=A0A951PP14_9CYAN|nr:hypothetical protein [Symplocastrum torsivum CPER-KK1]
MMGGEVRSRLPQKMPGDCIEGQHEYWIRCDRTLSQGNANSPSSRINK